MDIPLGLTPQEASHQRFAKARAWCVANLPDYNPDMAASAVLTLRLRGRWPTAREVRTRLEQSRWVEYARKEQAKAA